MALDIRRLLYYILFGALISIVAWNISQIITLDLGSFLYAKTIQLLEINRLPLTPPPYAILLTLITPALTLMMVTVEIFLSNPTRIKANWHTLSRHYLQPIIGWGIIAGIGLGALNYWLFTSDWSASAVRILTWISIGFVVGIAEGFSWSFRSIESESKKIQRIFQSPFLAGLGGLIAAIIIEVFRKPLGVYQEFVGFGLLGALIGFCLFWSARPTYQHALRLGHGFDYMAPPLPKDIESNPSAATIVLPPLQRPRIHSDLLKLIPGDIIEDPSNPNPNESWEGLSLQLPTKQNSPILIGDNENSHLQLPYLPSECARIEFSDGLIYLRALCSNVVKVQTTLLSSNQRHRLRHNQVITLHTIFWGPQDTDGTNTAYNPNSQKFYRFIFYDRFLDPQA